MVKLRLKPDAGVHPCNPNTQGDRGRRFSVKLEASLWVVGRGTEAKTKIYSKSSPV